MISEILLFNEKNVKKLIANYLPLNQIDRNLFSLIMWGLKENNCHYILVEADYIDRDFSEDYSAYYSSLFLEVGKKCCRLHFFSRVKNQDVSSLFGENRNKQLYFDFLSCHKKRKCPKNRVIKVNLTDLKESYLGFVIILPTNERVIGRTVIRSNVFCKEEYGYYCTTNCRIPVNIEGISLTVDAMPYIQQDERVGVCSSTAIWMATCYMSTRYKFQRSSLANITEMANIYHKINRPFPALRGLMSEQIIASFSKLGYDAIHYQKRTFQKNKWNPKEIIYKYIESELPVIVVIGGQHVCTIVGHNFDLDKNITDEKNTDNKITSNSSFITYFIVHDDIKGPYQLLPVEFSIPIFNNKEYLNPFKEQANIYTDYTLLDVTNIIVPIFKKVYLEGQTIENIISIIFSDDSYIFKYYQYLIENDFDFLNVETILIGKNFIEDLSGKNIFYRTRFLLSNHLKEDYLIYKSSTSLLLRNRYSQMDLPRYVWLIELFSEHNLRSKINQEKRDAKIVIGEILIDATGNDSMCAVITVHLPGILFINSLYSPINLEANEDNNEEKSTENKEFFDEESKLFVDSFIAYEITKDIPYELYDRSRATKS